MTWVASAPGKAMLAGEYAVLSGGPALVAAVERRQWARLEPSSRWGVRTASGASWDQGQPVPPELTFAAAAVEAASRRWSVEPKVLHLWDELSEPEGKLGLGRSAAVTVACTFAASHGSGAAPDDLWFLADEVHRAVQGRGSGADVAACVRGGVLRYTRSPLEAKGLEVHPDLRLLLVWSGTGADTGSRVDRFYALRQARPEEVASFEASSQSAVRELEEALASGDIHALRQAVSAAREALRGLERGLAMEMETAAMKRAADLAWEAGACGKLSGAGGGDCAVLFTVGDDDAARLEERLHAEGLKVFRTATAAPGARVERWADAG